MKSVNAVGKVHVFATQPGHLTFCSGLKTSLSCQLAGAYTLTAEDRCGQQRLVKQRPGSRLPPQAHTPAVDVTLRVLPPEICYHAETGVTKAQPALRKHLPSQPESGNSQREAPLPLFPVARKRPQFHPPAPPGTLGP